MNMAMNPPLSSGEQDISELIVDRMSSLPWNVLDNILGKLSIVEAARTSVLAKDWQYKWLSLSNLTVVFGDNAHFLDVGNVRWDRLSTIIDRFLLYHTSTIRTFHLRTLCEPHYSDVYSWIQYLSKQHLEELFLEDLDFVEHFQMPLHLFNFTNLRSLHLDNCALQVASTFGGFKTLQELYLFNILINDYDLEHLILACPLLVKLTLLKMPWLDHLRICAPKLTALEIDSRLGNIVIEAAACLISVCIGDAFWFHRKIKNWRSVICCLSSLEALQSLVLFQDFIWVLANDYALETFPLRNDTLTCLSLCDIRFENIEVFRVCLSLLNSCTNIKYFRFTIEAAKGPKLITAFFKEVRGLFSFSQLDSISVACPSGISLGCTVKFIEFLCAHSPNLKVLSIKKGGKLEMNNARISRMLLRFRKLCPQASIQYTYYRQ